MDLCKLRSVSKENIINIEMNFFTLLSKKYRTLNPSLPKNHYKIRPNTYNNSKQKENLSKRIR